MKRYFDQSPSQKQHVTPGLNLKGTNWQPGVTQVDTTTIATKDVNHANIFRNVRTDLLNA